MEFKLSEEQLMCQESAREFAARYITKERMEEADKSRSVPDDIFQGMCDAGFTGLVFDPEYGGTGLGMDAYVLTLEQLAKKDPNDVPTTVEGLEQTLDDVYNFNPKARTLDKIIGTDEWEGYGEVFNHELAMPYPGDDGPRMADPRLLRQHWARRYLPT